MSGRGLCDPSPSGATEPAPPGIFCRATIGFPHRRINCRWTPRRRDGRTPSFRAFLAAWRLCFTCLSGRQTDGISHEAAKPQRGRTDACEAEHPESGLRAGSREGPCHAPHRGSPRQPRAKPCGSASHKTTSPSPERAVQPSQTWQALPDILVICGPNRPPPRRTSWTQGNPRNLPPRTRSCHTPCDSLPPDMTSSRTTTHPNIPRIP